jgi:hypothetical protein
VKFRVVSSILFVIAVVGFAAVAAATPVVGGGLANSIACPDGVSPCSTNADFALDPPTPVKPATGTFTFGAATVDIVLNVASYSMTGSSGSVTALDFTNVDYTVTISVSYTDFGGGIVAVDQVPGIAVGSVSGTYDQIGGPGSGPFSDVSVSFSDFSCLLVDGQGQCGFDVGTFAGTADFNLDVDGSLYDINQTFNVIVPEPGTAALLGFGALCLVAWRRRRDI